MRRKIWLGGKTQQIHRKQKYTENGKSLKSISFPIRWEKPHPNLSVSDNHVLSIQFALPAKKCSNTAYFILQKHQNGAFCSAKGIILHFHWERKQNYNLKPQKASLRSCRKNPTFVSSLHFVWQQEQGNRAVIVQKKGRWYKSPKVNDQDVNRGTCLQK